MTTQILSQNVIEKIQETKTEKHVAVIKELIDIIKMQDQKMSELVRPLEKSNVKIFPTTDTLAQAVIETRIDMIQYETEIRLKTITNNI